MIWQQDRETVRWWLSDLLRAAFIALRHDQVRPPLAPWPDTFNLTGEGLGADSIELVDLAATLFDHTHAEQTGLLNERRLDAHFGTWLRLAHESLMLSTDMVVFYSSGSTGEPKRISHRSADLIDEITAFSAQLIPPPSRVLSAVATHHIYGFLFGLLLPHKLGCARLSLLDLAPQAALLQARPGDLVVAHPRWWDLALRGEFTIAPRVIGLSSTERCDEALFGRAAARGLERLIDIYGASETGGIGWREAPGCYQLMAHLDTVPANAPDQLEMINLRRFKLGPRRDRVVQVAGSKVSLAMVEAVLEKFPGVDHASAALSTTKPARLRVVLSSATICDSAGVRAALDVHLRQHLPTAAQPREILIQTLGSDD